MRLQLFFDGKPEAEVRDILKRMALDGVGKIIAGRDSLQTMPDMHWKNFVPENWEK